MVAFIATLVVISLISERSLFWLVASRLPSFRWFIYFGILVINLFTKRTIFKMPSIGIASSALLSVLHGLLSLMSAGSITEPWRIVLLMTSYHLVSLISGSTRNFPQRFSSITFLVFGLGAVIFSDRQWIVGAVYAASWFIGGIAGLIRAQVLKGSELEEVEFQESLVMIIIAIALFPIITPFQRFFPTMNHTAPLSSITAVISHFKDCLIVCDESTLSSDNCSYLSSALIIGWWLTHFSLSGILQRCLNELGCDKTSVIYSAGLFVTSVLLFTKFHSEQEIIGALAIFLGVLLSHLKPVESLDQPLITG